LSSSANRIFDRELQRRRLARAGGAANFLLDYAVDELCLRRAAVNRTFQDIADIGTPAAGLAQRLATGATRTIRLAPIPATIGEPPLLGFVGDEEALPLKPTGFDLVVSALALQSVNDLPGTLVQMRRCLRPDGLLLACLLAGRTLTELRTSLGQAEAEIDGGASPHIAPFADLRDLGGLLQRAGFALPVADLEPLTVRYSSMFALIADLRAMGAGNTLIERRKTPLKRSIFARAAEIYAERFADPDGRVRATFELAFLSGWVPHQSQQKPLKPGSAQMRLADALGVKEGDPKKG
jgi:SAM-dependent methyltransferase